MTELNFSVPGKGEALGTVDGKLKTALTNIKETVNGKLNHSNLEAAAAIERAQLAADAKRFTWYTPKVIATEETRENVAFGTLTTKDEIASVVLPENGLMLIGYIANFKSSVSAAGRAAVFIGANQLSASGAAQQALSVGTGFRRLHTAWGGLTVGPNENAWLTTGEILGSPLEAGFAVVFGAAGTYTVSAQFKATSGSVTAKERKLWVATLG
jgi:hypothetical protein